MILLLLCPYLILFIETPFYHSSCTKLYYQATLYEKIDKILYI